MEQNIIPKTKILLVLLPYWTPQVPPLGISCIKGFLQEHEYPVKTIDANVEIQSRTLYDNYFDLLAKHVSEERLGNFYNIGHEVLQNHMMAHLNYRKKDEYIKLVDMLIEKTFYCNIPTQVIESLITIVAEFYVWLDTFITDLLAKEAPLVLGLSVFKGNLPASMFAFKLTRKKHPHIQTVMGGAVFAQTLGLNTPNFNTFLEKTKDYIDKIIIGEGEQLFLKLLQKKLPVSQRVYTLEDMKGKFLDLSTTALPDYSDLNHQFYPNLVTYTSRSCPYQCNFCTETVYWGKYRKKNMKQVVNELQELYKRYHFQLFLLGDSLLNPVINQLAEKLGTKSTSIYWDGYLRIDSNVCDIDTVFKWRKSGFYRARLGVESGSPKILDAMDKKITIQEIKTAITNLAEAGIKTTTYWIIGYPGETEKDFQLTLDLIEELKDDIYEAECNSFGFYLSGQVNSNEWNNKNRVLPLYPEEFKKMLLLQSYIMECEPCRQETFRRVSRFVDHCSRLGIANPYSLSDINSGDTRWTKLHKNAVPPLLAFKNTEVYIDENKRVTKIMSAQNKLENDIVFGF